MEIRNAIFIVTEEHSCPIYNVGEEFLVEDSALSITSAKPACLKMVQVLLRVNPDDQVLERFTQQGIQRAKFECAGCTGLIRFEYKKEKQYATLQMKLLDAAEKRARMRYAEEFFTLLRDMDISESLSDTDLRDFTDMLKMQKYAAHKMVITQGERGAYLYIILSGRVAVVRDGTEVISELGRGEIFGEMSLLSGEPIVTSVQTLADTKLAVLSLKDFKHILTRYPILQVFFYRLLVNRVQTNTLRSGSISSGMTGDLAEINAVELFQLINSSGKTGKVDLLFANSHAAVLFHEGEIVSVAYGDKEGKDALFDLLALRSGTFTYTSGLSDEAKDLPVIGGFMGLIMEGLQRVDEQGQ